MNLMGPNTAGLAQRIGKKQKKDEFEILEPLRVTTCSINQF